MTLPIVERLRQFDGDDEVADTIEELAKVMLWFVRHGKGIAMDVKSCHDARGDGASEWMRRDDYDFRCDLSDALTRAQKLLAKIGGTP